MTGLTVRASTEADVARCMETYRHHVLHGTASFMGFKFGRWLDSVPMQRAHGDGAALP